MKKIKICCNPKNRLLSKILSEKNYGGEEYIMKKHMMIVGCDIVSSNESDPDESVFKITLMPLTTVKKVTAIDEIMSGGSSFEDMIGSAVEYQKGQNRDTVFINMGEWKKHNYKIGRHVTITVLPDNTTGGIK